MLKRSCKYKNECKHFRDTSYTCTHEGGPYCGKFRFFKQQKSKSKKEHVVEALI